MRFGPKEGGTSVFRYSRPEGQLWNLLKLFVDSAGSWLPLNRQCIPHACGVHDAVQI